MIDSFISVWPCTCGNVQIEPGALPLGLSCNACGSHPKHYVAVEALLSDEALEAHYTAPLGETAAEGAESMLRAAIDFIRDVDDDDVVAFQDTGASS